MWQENAAGAGVPQAARPQENAQFRFELRLEFRLELRAELHAIIGVADDVSASVGRVSRPETGLADCGRLHFGGMSMTSVR